MTLKCEPTPIAGVSVVHSIAHADARGMLMRLYCEHELASIAGARRIVQANLSRTNAVGTVRGLHLQHGAAAEMKFIRCLRGQVWDVAVDLRRGSPTFLQWYARTLSANDGAMMVIPEGCAHGFQVLEGDAELLYLHTAAYSPSAEAGFHCQDPTLAIAWPMPVAGLSERDRAHPLIDRQFAGLDT